MSFAVVKLSSGYPVIVSNVVKDSAGAEHTVLADVKESDATPHTIFGASVETVPVIEFTVTAKREFTV